MIEQKTKKEESFPREKKKWTAVYQTYIKL